MRRTSPVSVHALSTSYTAWVDTDPKHISGVDRHGVRRGMWMIMQRIKHRDPRVGDAQPHRPQHRAGIRTIAQQLHYHSCARLTGTIQKKARALLSDRVLAMRLTISQRETATRDRDAILAVGKAKKRQISTRCVPCPFWAAGGVSGATGSCPRGVSGRVVSAPARR